MAVPFISRELSDVQTAIAIGELPNVEYCGLVEAASSEAPPDPHRWLLIVQGCDDDGYDGTAQLRRDHPSRVGDHNALFYGVTLHLEVTFPMDYPFSAPRFRLLREWLAPFAPLSYPWWYPPVRPPPPPDAATVAANLRQDLIVGESACRRALVRDALSTGSRLFRSFFPNCVAVSFTVATMTGKRLLFSNVRADSTVLDLMNQEGVAFEHQQLVHRGVTLQRGDRQTLRQYGIENGDVLHRISPLGDVAAHGTLVGPSPEQWACSWPVSRMLTNLRSTLLSVSAFARFRVPMDHDHRVDHLRQLVQACRCNGEVHWRLRAAWPQRDVVWSPERFAEWPLYFRRCVRYLRKVAVHDGTGTVRPLPYDIVNEIATFL